MFSCEAWQWWNVLIRWVNRIILSVYLGLSLFLHGWLTVLPIVQWAGWISWIRCLGYVCVCVCCVCLMPNDYDLVSKMSIRGKDSTGRKTWLERSMRREIIPTCQTTNLWPNRGSLWVFLVGWKEFFFFFIRDTYGEPQDDTLSFPFVSSVVAAQWWSSAVTQMPQSWSWWSWCRERMTLWPRWNDDNLRYRSVNISNIWEFPFPGLCQRSQHSQANDHCHAQTTGKWVDVNSHVFLFF